MMDWTDRHCRYFHRLLAPSVTLYTEMVTANALIHADVERHLRYDNSEHPVSLQLGGSDPQALAEAVRISSPYNYDEYNLNCGCPSDRVQSGAFGACLMAEPETVRHCVQAMMNETNKPITIKCRLGIDDADEETMLRQFIETVSQSGCKTFIIHARKAWLKGLSPKENRDIPPLNYDLVKKMKNDYEGLNIQLNGGLTSLEQITDLISDYDGVMIGRAAYQNPRLLIDIEKQFFNTQWQVKDHDIILAMIGYANNQQERFGTPVKTVTKHMINYFQSIKGARKWRQIISAKAPVAKKAEDVLIPAYESILSQQ
jgi:tRNA-dihydrouridine synthase A